MITGFSGTRDGVPDEFFLEAIEFSGFMITKVVHGAQRGVDTQAKEWAIKNNIPEIGFSVTPTDWRKFGRGAGPIRNAKMAQVIEQCIIIPGPNSLGSWDMFEKCNKLNIPCFVHEYGG